MEPSEYIDDFEGLKIIFGVLEFHNPDVEDPLLVPGTQDLGSITTPQGRMLAWPSVMQHKVEPFQLLDKTRAGHRSCVVLYLVDPNYRICSTRNVPPQQHDWWAGAALSKSNFPPNSVATSLPQELKDPIMKETEHWPMGTAEATQIRTQVEEDRGIPFKAVMECIDWPCFYFH